MSQTSLDFNKAFLAIHSLSSFFRTSLVVPGLRRTGVYKDLVILVGSCKDDGSQRGDSDFEVLRVLICGGLKWMKILSADVEEGGCKDHDYAHHDAAAADDDEAIIIFPHKVCSAMQRLALRSDDDDPEDVFVPNRAFLHRVWQFYHAGAMDTTTTTTTTNLSFQDRMAWTVSLVHTLVDAGGKIHAALLLLHEGLDLDEGRIE